MIDKHEPTAAYYRKVAAQIRDLARGMQLPQVRSDLVDLAERFELLAAYVEKRYPNGRGRVPPENAHDHN